MNAATIGKPLPKDIEQGITGYVDCGYGLIQSMLSSDEVDR